MGPGQGKSFKNFVRTVIVFLGLGPGDPNLLTREAWDVLSNATQVFLRTRKHPAVAGLPKGLHLRSFDALYDRARDFEAVYAAISAAILAAARKPGTMVIYAVPGHPLVGERTTPMILDQARALGIPVRIVAGLSFVEPTLEALALAGQAQGLDPIGGLQICDGLDLAAGHHPALNPDRPALVAQMYSRAVASNVKLTLLNQYPPGHTVTLVQGASRVCAQVPLHTLDHADVFDPLTSLYIPALARISAFESLQETIAHLRAPEGCPWDREQTHQSLRNTLLEEAYEVLTAIDEDDMPALAEELGDLLLNIILQAQIASEAGEFLMSDVVAGIDAKLKRRHPHVFGGAQVKNSAEVNANWNAIKRQEKAAQGRHAASVLDGIAPALPALAQAQKIAHRADRAGFRWKRKSARFAKVLEEIDEIRRARTPAHRQEELGDLLITLAYWADGYGIDIESAAREANQKFTRRFHALEKLLRGRGQDMARMSEAQLLDAWREIKKGL